MFVHTSCCGRVRRPYSRRRRRSTHCRAKTGGSSLVDLKDGVADLDTLSRQLAVVATVLDWGKLIANATTPAGFENVLLSASSTVPEITVFMSIDATAAEIDAMRSRLAAI